jgi:hypothetical protein
MADQPLNVLRSAELKRGGIAAVEQALRAGPVHLLKRNSPAAVVISEAEYNRLRRLADRPAAVGPSCLDWLLALPSAATARSKQEIDAERAKAEEAAIAQQLAAQGGPAGMMGQQPAPPA